MTEVILVDENDVQTGTIEKMEAHRQGLLHRAFSIFIFNSRGDFLLQQRAPGKYHNGGLWTNTCCSHPGPGETVMEAASRRLVEEMGFTTRLSPVFSFVYKTTFDNGLSEHEYDHVFTGIYDGPLNPDPLEASDFRYVDLPTLEGWMKTSPAQFTHWFKIAFPQVCRIHQQYFYSKIA
ncbi:MAG: isopentenyl-diphosphate Delta-isomerase [Bacteroidota bacterium]|nr:isopentenyl-diphosphate Delta-isomerase [Bacteroidota bacterium]